MRKNIFVLFFLVIIGFSYGQNTRNSHCGTDVIYKNSLRNNKSFKDVLKENQRAWERYALSNSHNNRNISNPPANLIVVFHDVIGNANSSQYLLDVNTNNVSDYQYIIDGLNGYFGNNIQFCLAKKDSFGDFIHLQDLQYINSNSTDIDVYDFNNTILPIINLHDDTRFPDREVINIYLVDNITGPIDGFASMPSDQHYYIFVERNKLINNADFNNNIKVLIHELGHYLGLYHTFQSTAIYNSHSFTYDNRTYQIVYSAKKWEEAALDAKKRGGKLVEINDQAEQDAIEIELQNEINSNNIDLTQSLYIWTGGTYHNNHWVWDGDNDNVTDPITFTNWGQNQSTTGISRIGISLNNTSFGEWYYRNYLNSYFYIIEYPVKLIPDDYISENYNCLNDGDMVCDTPPHLNPLSPQAQGNNTCTDYPEPTITDGTHPSSVNGYPDYETDDPSNNIMNYTPLSQRTMFTPGQIERMEFMLFDDVGPRKYLVHNKPYCDNCYALESCNFFIIKTPSNVVQTNRNYIHQNTTVTFSGGNDCNNNNVDYRFTLIRLANSNTVLQTDVPNSISTTGLDIGNYRLKMKALSTDANSSPDCFETVTLDFSIIPPLTTCNLSLPIDNNDWNDINPNSNWQRLSFSNGNWIGPQTPDNPLDNSGFDIIPIQSGQTISNDPNFSNDPNYDYTLPQEANINRVMRVGQIYNPNNSNGGGKAYYAQITLTPTQDNCRYRIWYLGGTEGNRGQYLFYKPNIANNKAAFGWVCDYRYNSPAVENPGNNYNSHIGSTYNFGELNFEYPLNDLISFGNNSPYMNQFTNGTFHKLKSWHYYDVDFSEFINKTPQSTITITFFSHADDAGISLQNAYAYFGIECLGGGIPEHLDLDIDDVYFNCNTGNDTQLITLNFPTYNYMPRTSQLDNEISNFYKIKVELHTPNNNWVEVPIFINPGYFQFHLNPNLPYTDSNGNIYQYTTTYREYKLTYQSLNETLTDIFRVFPGGANEDLELCQDGSDVAEIASANPPQQMSGGYYQNDARMYLVDNKHAHYFYFNTNDLPDFISATPSCLQNSERFIDYTWLGIFGETLYQSIQSDPFYLPINYFNHHSNFNVITFFRKVRYLNICDSPGSTQYVNFYFHNYSRVSFYKESITQNDVCYDNDVMNSDLIDVRINGVTISKEQLSQVLISAIGNDFNFDDNNIRFTLHYQNNGIDTDFGPTLTWHFTGQLQGSSPVNVEDYNYDGQTIHSDNGDLHFVFRNEDPTNPGTPLFIPTNNSQTFPISLHITGNYSSFTGYGNGSGLDMMIPLFDLFIKNSAIGGEIYYDVNSDSILNNNNVINWSADNVYGWQYFNTNTSSFEDLPGAPNTVDLPDISTYLQTYCPLKIRRVSFGTEDCPGVKYSNEVEISAGTTPIFDQVPSICEGDVLSPLPTTSNNGITGSWSPALDNTQTTTYTFTPDAGQCATPTTMTIEVTPLPIEPNNLLSNPNSSCKRANAVLSYVGGMGDVFNWYSGSCGGNYVGSGNNLSISVNSTTVFYGRWENSCGVSQCKNVTVRVDTSFPIANMNILLNGSPQIFFIDNSLYAYQYEWDFGDNSPFSYDMNTEHTYLPGAYTVIHTVKNACGTDSVKRDIFIKDDLSINEIKKDDILIYPNPVGSTLTLYYPIKTKIKIQIISLDGKIIQEKDFDNLNKIKIDVHKLSTGLYFLKIINRKINIKFIKK